VRQAGPRAPGADVPAGVRVAAGAGVSPPLEPARALMATRATTFSLASSLLPPGLRDDVARLYLVFRSLDDLVDDGDPGASERVAAVSAWARSQPGADSPEVRALRDLARRHPISREAVSDFCLGMEQDLAPLPFASERDVDRYCYRVAGTVGLVLAGLLGAASPDAGACAVALGMAMQRTNILRDLDEDLAAGRMYVSEETRARHPGGLEAGRRGPLLRALIRRADDLYREGEAGIGSLRHGRFAVRLATALYREILSEIERRDRRGLGGRAVVSEPRKLAIAGRVVLTAA
jgi:phytoene synthase